MILTIEIIMLCILFSIIIIIGKKKKTLVGLHNLPKAIQERVVTLLEYKYKNIQFFSVLVGVVIIITGGSVFVNLDMKIIYQALVAHR